MELIENVHIFAASNDHLAIRVESREGQGFIDTAHLKTTFRGGFYFAYYYHKVLIYDCPNVSLRTTEINFFPLITDTYWELPHAWVLKKQRVSLNILRLVSRVILGYFL